MHYTIKKGSTSRILLIDIYDSSSTVGARLAGLVYNTASLSAYYNREGAAGAATAITLATATKGTWATGGFIAIDATNMPGHYELHIPDAALATGANSVMVELKGATNMVPKTILIELVDNVEADTYTIVNNGTYGNSALNTAIAGVQADADNIQTRIPTALVSGRIDASVGAVAADAITAAAIANGAIDRATFAADTGLQNIRANTAQAGAASTITLDAGASAVDSYYNECWVYITGGTGAGQTRVITAYVGATKVATITPNWTTNPDATSTFAIWGVSRNDGISSGATDWSTAEKNQIRQALGVDGTKAATASGDINTLLTESQSHPTLAEIEATTVLAKEATLTPIQSDTNDIQSRLPAVLVGGRIDSSVGAMAANTLTASALATDAVDEIVDSTWDEVLTGATHNVNQSSGKRLRQLAAISTVDGSVNDASATTTSFITTLTGVANNFYADQLIIFTSGALNGQSKPVATSNGTTGVITFDEAFTAAPANSDTFTLFAHHIHPVTQIADAVWDALTAAITAVGSIGKLIVDNVNATISSRSSHTAADVWSAATRTLTSFGTLVSDIWANATRTLTSFGTLISDIWTNATRTLTSVGGIKKNTAFNNFDFLMVDSTDHVTGETGLTVTAQRSINGGAFAACANAVSELANGKYLINLAASDLNGDIIALRFTATGADTRNITIITTP